jgi:hypothetical protein
MPTILKTLCAVIAATALVACEKHLENNQDSPAQKRVPPNSEQGTPTPENPPPVAPTTGSKGTTPTGTR